MSLLVCALELVLCFSGTQTVCDVLFLVFLQTLFQKALSRMFLSVLNFGFSYSYQLCYMNTEGNEKFLTWTTTTCNIISQRVIPDVYCSRDLI